MDGRGEGLKGRGGGKEGKGKGHGWKGRGREGGLCSSNISLKKPLALFAYFCQNDLQ